MVAAKSIDSFDMVGMRCPVCGSSSTHVIESRSHNGSVLRRRECRKMHHKFTTREVFSSLEGLSATAKAIDKFNKMFPPQPMVKL